MLQCFSKAIKMNKPIFHTVDTNKKQGNSNAAMDGVMKILSLTLPEK
jgi:hypothetical protein